MHRSITGIVVIAWLALGFYLVQTVHLSVLSVVVLTLTPGVGRLTYFLLNRAADTFSSVGSTLQERKIGRTIRPIHT